jgi:hypothetical protein
MSEEKILLEKIEEEEEYFNTHYEEFLDKYEGLVLVIKDKKVVESDEDLEKVLEKLKRRQINLREVFITSLPKKSIAFIL